MRKSIGIVIVLGVFLTISGCRDKNKETAVTALPTQKSTMETLAIYSVDSDTMNLIPATVKKEKRTVTPEYITGLVEDSLEDENVRVYSIKQEGERIILSFYKDGKPIRNCSKSMETLILDCFANSLLDNVAECTKVVFRCEDKAYKSEHSSFQIDEVYASE